MPVVSLVVVVAAAVVVVVAAAAAAVVVVAAASDSTRESSVTQTDVAKIDNRPEPSQIDVDMLTYLGLRCVALLAVLWPAQVPSQAAMSASKRGTAKHNNNNAQTNTNLTSQGAIVTLGSRNVGGKGI
jgi:hypothetical protein